MTTHNYRDMHYPLSRQKGITLLEVLVSVLIMSIALLGMAGLQSHSLAQQTAANSRGSIALLVSDFADRLRTNQNQIATDPATFAVTDDWTKQQTDLSAMKFEDCATSTCTSAQRITYDVSTWRQKVRETLPQGSVQVSGNVFDGISVTLMWLDKGFVDTGGSADTLRQSTACAVNLAIGAKSNCCPAAAKVPAGVRCHNVTMIP